MKLVFPALLSMFLFLPIFAFAHEEKAMDVEFRLTPTGSGAGYMKIYNGSKETVRLTGAKSPMIDRIEIHSMTQENGIMKMRALKEIVIAPGKTLQLKPGGRHLMLFGVMPHMRVGETLPLTLFFDGDHRLETRAEIVPLTGKKKRHKMPPEKKHKH